MFTVETVGLQELILRLENTSEKMTYRVAIAMQSAVDALQDKVKERMGSYFSNPGEMQNSLSSGVESSADDVTGTVTASGLPYLRILEYGGQTAAHSIFPKNGSALAFMMPGRVPFRTGAASGMFIVKSVEHPGSKFPERPYMRSALAMMKKQIVETLRPALVADQ